MALIGTQLVRIAVHENDFDKLENLMASMESKVNSFEPFRKVYGRLRWTAGHSLVNDDWIYTYIDKAQFDMIRGYGSYMSKIWNEKEQVIPHFYEGNVDANTPCPKCGKEASDPIHLRNGGVICDNPNGPCACGAWHKEGEVNNIHQGQIEEYQKQTEIKNN